MNIRQIKNAVSLFYNVDIEEKTRRREVSHARAVAMYIMVVNFNYTFGQVASTFGVHRTTVITMTCRVGLNEKLRNDANFILKYNGEKKYPEWRKVREVYYGHNNA